MDHRAERIQNAAEYLRSQLQGRQPVVGIVLGSGLGKLAEKIADPIVIPYRTIPGFPVSTAIGHKGNFMVGELGGKTVIAMQGRIHYYEGYPMELVTLPIRVMKVIGIRNLFVSNAAGGINFDFKVGDLMIIRDHINLLPNPLIGPNLDDFGPRFPDMTHPYDKSLIAKAKEIASQMKLELREGVYIAGTGPSYETPAEWHFFRTIGADAVGMSTVPETIVGNYAGMEVFGISCITNMATGIATVKHSHEEVVRVANEASEKLCSWMKEFIMSI